MVNAPFFSLPGIVVIRLICPIINSVFSHAHMISLRFSLEDCYPLHLNRQTLHIVFHEQ